MGVKMNKTQIRDAFKRIRNNLDLSKRPAATIAVLSANPGEGRSTVAWKLASSYAEKGDKVLLIASDVLNADLAAMAKAQSQEGLRELILQADPGKPVFNMEAVEEIKSENGAPLYFLAAGQKRQGMDVISSRGFARLVREASRDLDKIILDSPAATVSADAYIIGSLADESLFVYDASYTGKQEARQAMEDLERNGAKIYGVVMTNVGKEK